VNEKNSRRNTLFRLIGIIVAVLMLIVTMSLSLHNNFESKADVTSLNQAITMIERKADKDDLKRVENQSIFRDEKIMLKVDKNQEEIKSQYKEIIKILVKMEEED
jgi:hypothetical protein